MWSCKVGLISPELTGKTFLTIALKYNQRMDEFLSSFSYCLLMISNMIHLYSSNQDLFLKNIPRLRLVIKRNNMVKRIFEEEISKISFIGYNNLKDFYNILVRLKERLEDFLRLSLPKSLMVEKVRVNKYEILVYHGKMLNLENIDSLEKFLRDVNGNVIYTFSPSNLYKGLLSFRQEDYLKAIERIETEMIHRPKVNYIITMTDEKDPESIIRDIFLLKENFLNMVP